MILTKGTQMSKVFKEIQKANAIREMLLSEGDDVLTHDMIEGETDLYKMLDWAIGKVGDEREMQEAIKLRVGSLSARKKASENRMNRMRNMTQEIIEAIGIRKYSGAEASIGFMELKPKTVIDDDFEFGERFYKTEVTLNKKDVLAAIKSGDIKEGFHLSNGSESFVMRFG